MAIQKNYFAYNIIDAIYYNTPTDEDMKNIYGKKYFRRSDYNNLTPEQKANFEQQEKEFIQAVINKYVMNNNITKSYIGKFTQKPNISYAYIPDYTYMPLQVSDMISNINGMHIYKLLSAKDIDFDNVILPNSAISRDFNWGYFDEKRRWGNKPIHINNTFELLNVIDYLLCACNNIWNELYKLKYNENKQVDVWFVVKADDTTLILETRKINNDDFKRENINKHEVKLLTTLNPYDYYSTVKTINNGLFGIGTNFYIDETDPRDLAFQRKILNNNSSRNIIIATISADKLIEQPAASTTQLINGEPYSIYGYAIGNDLKIYPGENIKTFTNNSSQITDIELLVDLENKKLKNDTFFRVNTTTYKRVYIEFLYNYKVKNNENKNLHSTIEHPYILYYIGDDNIKHVLAVHVLTTDIASRTEYNNFLSLTSEQFILSNFLNNNEYDITYLCNVNNGQIQPKPKNQRFQPSDGLFYKNLNVLDKYEDEEIIYEPIFYIVNDEYSLQLEITLPATSKNSLTYKDIVIYYYKNENKMTGNIFMHKDKNHHITNTEINNIMSDEVYNDENFKEINLSIDNVQTNSVSYCLERYNIPENQEIYIKINATYIANGSSANPLNLALSDEYKDIGIYDSELENINIDNYYYFNGINNENHRIFNRYTNTNNLSQYRNYDVNGNVFYHAWKKIENPYKLEYELVTNSLIKQETLYDNVKNNVNNSQHIKLNQLSYNMYSFKGTLDENIEQIKFDIDFIIDETSKVKRSKYTCPINLNKIYNLSINYIGEEIIHSEASRYSNYIYNTNNGTITLSQIMNDYGGQKYFVNIYDSNKKISYYNIVKKLNDNIDTSDLTNKNTYDNSDNPNNIFNISYSNENKYINLLGSFYTGKKLKFNNNSKYAQIKISNDNDSFPYKDASYIFNINGFNKNYRLHGYNEYFPINNNINIDILSYYDLLSNIVTNEDNSINSFLNFKLSEGNNEYQLAYISYKTNNLDQYIWTKYDNTFKSGNNKDNDYILKTIPVDIVKTTYQIDVHNLTQNNMRYYITYYIPIAYMYINSSTFYPPLSTIPNKEYNFNNEEDIIKYQNYITCWDDDNNYRPITLSLKLLENTNYSNPYFYESNEAKMKFNILRSQFTGSINVGANTNTVVFISIGEKFYLSDFIKFQNNNYPSGSYLYYDNENTHSYIVNEIYGNYSDTNQSIIHNIHYQNSTVNNTLIFNNIYFPYSNSGNNTKKIIYPIFKQNENSYYYDIYRISDINKIKTIKNESQLILETSGNNKDLTSCLYYDNILSYIYINDTICEGDNYSINNNLGTLKLKIKQSTDAKNIYNSKNLTISGTNVSEGYYNIDIMPIIRQKDEHFTEHESLYKTTTINNIIYEFFEFKYNDIYLLEYDSINDNITEINNQLFKENPTLDELKTFYTQQLYYFVNNNINNKIYLLCNSSIKEEYLSNL